MLQIFIKRLPRQRTGHPHPCESGIVPCWVSGYEKDQEGKAGYESCRGCLKVQRAIDSGKHEEHVEEESEPREPSVRVGLWELRERRS